MLRRTKALVAHELPPKVETIDARGTVGQTGRPVRNHSPGHGKNRARGLNTKGLAKSQITILDALLKLRQVCCDPRLLKLARPQKVKASAKLEQLMELAARDAGRGAADFAVFAVHQHAELIEAELKSAASRWVKLTGQSQNRDAADRAIHQRPGAAVPDQPEGRRRGLNLPQADTVIHYDPWWNPAVETRPPTAPTALARPKVCGWSNWWPRARLRSASWRCRSARPRWPRACTADRSVASSRCSRKVTWQSCSDHFQLDEMHL
jgi:hypothetical protein